MYTKPQVWHKNNEYKADSKIIWLTVLASIEATDSEIDYSSVGTSDEYEVE